MVEIQSERFVTWVLDIAINMGHTIANINYNDFYINNIKMLK